jgi:hypothetical protein
MSRGDTVDVTCKCGCAFREWIWRSANVTLEPELRQMILDGNMNVVKCPSCGARFHVEVPFFYNDMDRRLWIWVYPARYSADAAAIAAEVEAMWQNIRATMPAALRDGLETNYKTMVLFGMDGLVRHLKQEEASPKPTGDGTSST